MKQNIFFGDSYYTLFALKIYKRLISREWFTYADVMADHLGKESLAEFNVSNCDNYGELKKAFRDLRKTINDKIGQECLEEDGNNRNKRFRYIGTEDDPLSEMRDAKVINDLKEYWQFCQNSAGFFPLSWLEYFFKDTMDLLDIKTKRRRGEQVLSTSFDRMLTNIEYLPLLYDAIVNKQVLSITYKPYIEEERTLIFHPHYLKEFNGRWFLFGHAEGKEPEFGYNIALDRIVRRPFNEEDCEYDPAPRGFYDDYFKDIVGVTHLEGYKAQPVHIRVHDEYMYKSIETKPIHPSQKESVPFGEHDDGKYGELVVNVELNNEFVGRILQMGNGIEVVAPKEIRDKIKNRVLKMAKHYESD